MVDGGCAADVFHAASCERQYVGFLIGVLAEQRDVEQRHGAADFGTGFQVRDEGAQERGAFFARPVHPRGANNRKFILTPRPGLMKFFVDF